MCYANLLAESIPPLEKGARGIPKMLIPAKNLANKLFGPSYPYFGKIISKPCNFTIA